MINAAFNVGAIAGAKAARESSREPISFGNYTREYKPKVTGYITIESDEYTSVQPSLSVVGFDVKFSSVIAVNKLIDKLTRLRDDMIKAERGSVAHDFQVGDYVYASDWCYGQIVEIDGDFIYVEFDTGSGGGTVPFEAHEVRLCED